MYKITDALIERAQADRPWSEIAKLFPLMGEDEFDGLCISVKEHGIKDAIDCYGNEVIDGRNRQLAALATGRDPLYNDMQGEWSPDQLARHSWTSNYERRHLTPSQKGLAAAKMREFLVTLGGNTVKAAAAATGSSERTVKRASRVLAQGSPELIQAVEQGRIKVDDAESILKLPHVQQAERVEAVTTGRAKYVAQPQADSGTSDQEAWLQNVQISYHDSEAELGKILKRFEKLNEAGELVNFPWNKFRVELESAKSMVHMNTPHKYCCGGKGGTECICDGTGFITRFNWDSPEIRAKFEGKA